MNRRRITRTRIFTLAIAGLSLASIGPARADEPAPTTRPASAQSGATLDVETTGDGRIIVRETRLVLAEEPVAGSEQPRPRGGGGGGGSSGGGVVVGAGGGNSGGGGGGFGGGGFPATPGAPPVPARPGATLPPAMVYERNLRWSAERAASPLIITQPMDAAVQAEWKEDLAILSKLLREQVVKTAGEPSALGIRMTTFGQSSPIYIEDCGVLYTAMVTMPLASSTKPAAKGEDQKQPAPESEWQRIKSEMHAAAQPTVIAGTVTINGEVMGVNTATSTGNGTLTLTGGSIQVFNQAKVDALVDGLLKALPEAKNIRHLKDDESVIINIAGTDDRGEPVSLTMKAKKTDIDAAAAGKLTPGEFKTKVAVRIG